MTGEKKTTQESAKTASISRREFLKDAGFYAGCAAVLGLVATSCKGMSDDAMKTGTTMSTGMSSTNVSNMSGPTVIMGTCCGAVALSYDGANMWIVNALNDNVTKLKASDGSFVGTYNVGTNPMDICFDGTNMCSAAKADHRGAAWIAGLKACSTQ